jgi:hypothetical protein
MLRQCPDNAPICFNDLAMDNFKQPDRRRSMRDIVADLAFRERRDQVGPTLTLVQSPAPAASDSSAPKPAPADDVVNALSAAQRSSARLPKSSKRPRLKNAKRKRSKTKTNPDWPPRAARSRSQPHRAPKASSATATPVKPKRRHSENRRKQRVRSQPSGKRAKT